MKAVAVIAALMLSACQAQPPASAPAGDANGAAGQDVPLPPQLPIGQIQGRAARSARVDQLVSIQGVVVGNFSKGLQGVFVQSERDDGDPLTAEGLFVEHAADAEPRLRTGDRVRLSGRVVEQGDEDGTLTALRDTVIEVIGQRRSGAGRARSRPGLGRRLGALRGNGDCAFPRRSRSRATTAFHAMASSPQVSTGVFSRPPRSPCLARQPAGSARTMPAARLLLDDNRTSKNPRNLWFLPRNWTMATRCAPAACCATWSACSTSVAASTGCN